MKYIAKGKDVVMHLRSIDLDHVVAQCHNEKWAEHIAGLLQKHYDEGEQE